MSKKIKLHPDWIDPHALRIVKTLQERGFTTYLVGGCVRDLLLEKRPKDFDIATTAQPRQVKKFIPQSFIIGKRFRLVLVKKNHQQFEVATFRRNIKEEENSEDLPPGDNLFGTPEEDAMRRDFTINGLFYDPIHDKLIDYPGGLKDLEKSQIKMIGDPEERLVEDPIRILRALRLAHMTSFSYDPKLRAAIKNTAPTLTHSALPRRREEFLKFLRLKDPWAPFIESYDLNVLKEISPSLNEIFAHPQHTSSFLQLINLYFEPPINKDSPLELFGGLVLAYLRTLIEDDPRQSLKAHELLDHPHLQSLMKNELGMFKYEQSLFAKAIQIESHLARKKDFIRRSSRRQKSLLKNEAFPLALHFAQKDLLLSGTDYFFWLNKYQEQKAAKEQKVDEKTSGR